MEAISQEQEPEDAQISKVNHPLQGPMPPDSASMGVITMASIAHIWRPSTSCHTERCAAGPMTDWGHSTPTVPLPPQQQHNEQDTHIGFTSGANDWWVQLRPSTSQPDLHSKRRGEPELEAPL